MYKIYGFGCGPLNFEIPDFGLNLYIFCSSYLNPNFIENDILTKIFKSKPKSGISEFKNLQPNFKILLI